MATTKQASSSSKSSGSTKKDSKQYKMYKLYEVNNTNIKRKNKTCPKCSSVFMANHKDRWTCGKCGYMEKK